MEMSKAHLTMVSKLHYQTVFLGEFSHPCFGRKRALAMINRICILLGALMPLTKAGQEGVCLFSAGLSALVMILLGINTVNWQL